MPVILRAHAVCEGDAFELRWGTKRVLIDGGIDPEQTLRLVSRRGAGPFDAVVCTHNDSDHACGLLYILAAGYARTLTFHGVAPRKSEQVCVEGFRSGSVSAELAG